MDSRYRDTQTVKAGSSLILPVNFSGVPAPKATWYRNGSRLANQKGHIHMDTGDAFSTLTVTGIEPEEAGKYRLHLENSAGKTEFEFDVRVKSK